MDAFILLVIVLVCASAVAYLLNMSRKGREGTKGITKEYLSQTGVKRTALKDREEHIV
jgi:hypothetical protein